MYVNQMSCCGMFEAEHLGDESYYNEELDTNWPDPPRYRRVPRAEGIRKCMQDIRNELQGIHPRGRVVIATTTNNGMSREIAALKRLRWTVVKRFRNGNSGNRVTVWMKHVR